MIYLISSVEKNLIDAFFTEYQANMRYSVFSQLAKKQGYPNISRLFRAIAYSEKVHALNHFDNISPRNKLINTDHQNLELGQSLTDNVQLAIDGESYEIQMMYPLYMENAKNMGDKKAEASFHDAWMAEIIHKPFFEKALIYLNQNKDLPLDQMGICWVCGYTVEGEIPERCPICNYTDKYRIFS